MGQLWSLYVVGAMPNERVIFYPSSYLGFYLLHKLAVLDTSNHGVFSLLAQAALVPIAYGWAKRML